MQEQVHHMDSLEQSWQHTLPGLLNVSDGCSVVQDASNPNALRIHIDAAGRNQHSFDFKCTYVDEREVKVELVDVEQANVTVDERSETMQHMIKDYVRHIHECAQALQHDI
ncbi:hypothetical protein [Longirhabdus pacifica]|uniref:hypothetical protein n=1 Tax=Longirhabdus pacifica TaxID=2305227 RepID=UPI001008B98E|nr:hypothetical protein [Longirhabdus pacifica]